MGFIWTANEGAKEVQTAESKRKSEKQALFEVSEGDVEIQALFEVSEGDVEIQALYDVSVACATR